MNSGLASKIFWKNKNVLVTGHTGFKGSWLCIWLERLGANVTGISLPPSTSPNLFELISSHNLYKSVICDIRNLETLSEQCKAANPEFIFHLAAQPLVRESYLHPVDTFSSNIMGTANILESMRDLSNLKAAVMITTDKVYQEQAISKPYKEDDPLGGFDPYSSSKAACEIIIDSYKKSFLADQAIYVASARAGNVIGGGDWSQDRLIPDAIRAWEKNEILLIRRPNATRPWQHVLEPLHGYLILAQEMHRSEDKAQAYNFGPHSESTKSVKEVINLAKDFFGGGEVAYEENIAGPHEADWLSLDITKSINEIGFHPRWNLPETIEHTISWYKNFSQGEDALLLCNQQIDLFESSI